MRRIARVGLVIAVVVGTLLVVPVLAPASRPALGRAYVHLAEAWVSHWPVARGHYLVYRLDPIMRLVGVVPVIVELAPGETMLLDPRDDVQKTIIMSGHWQPEAWGVMKSALPAGGVFVDVGAHVGFFTVKGARAVGTAGRVIAIEPNPETLKELNGNIRASGLTNVQVIPVACTDSDQTLTLYSERDHPAGASLSERNAGTRGGRASFSVRGRRLDDVVQELSLARIDVIKIDVEGAETLVLRGALGTLRRYRPVLIIELMPQNLKGMGTSLEEVLATLTDVGYPTGQRIDETDWMFRPDGGR